MVRLRQNELRGVSLFSSAGIGELGLRANGVEVVVSNEIDARRHALYRHNYPTTECISRDIRLSTGAIIARAKERLNGDECFMVYATPPCQGMSTNGIGKLLNGVRSGERSAVDERNRLVIPALDVIEELHPRWVLFENVPGMKNTIIADANDRPVNVSDYIAKRLGPAYTGAAQVVACNKYGIPQLRRRLITLFTRDKGGASYFNRSGFTFFPEAEQHTPRTLREAISELPPLEAVSGLNARPEFHPLHCVPVMNAEKHWWLTNTPEGDTAFNNQCVNPACGFTGNARHVDVKNAGMWKSSITTPIVCEKCGELLPRPSLIDKKTLTRRLLKGFHSAYRRMKWDEPAPTLTQNFRYEASDNKVHPSQTRVLSIYEALVLQTIADYDYDFRLDGDYPPPAFLAEIIGESVPPKLIEVICAMMIRESDYS